MSKLLEIEIICQFIYHLGPDWNISTTTENFIQVLNSVQFIYVAPNHNKYLIKTLSNVRL